VLAFNAPGSVPPDDATIISRIDSSGGLGFDSFIDFTTNPSSMTIVGLDLTMIPERPDNYESGDGVLARVTIQAVGDGVTVLGVGGPLGGQDGFPDTIINSGVNLGTEIPITTVQDGWIAVGAACPASPPTPTPNCPLVPWPVLGGDDDCDGLSSADEIAIGTDPNDACGSAAPTRSRLAPTRTMLAERAPGRRTSTTTWS